MNFGGLGAQGALKRKQLKKCTRCGLWHPEADSTCHHCEHCETDAELRLLKKSINSQQHAAGNIGGFFIVVSVIICIVLALSFI